MHVLRTGVCQTANHRVRITERTIMNSLWRIKTFRRSIFFILLSSAIPLVAHGQAPSVTTGGAGHVEGEGEGLSGTASYSGHGLVNLYTWFQWGTTTAYGNV